MSASNKSEEIAKQMLIYESWEKSKLGKIELEYLVANGSDQVSLSEPTKKANADLWKNWMNVDFKKESTGHALCLICRERNKAVIYKVNTSTKSMSKENIMHAEEEKTANEKSEKSLKKSEIGYYVEKELSNANKSVLTKVLQIGLCMNNDPFFWLEKPGSLLIMKAISVMTRNNSGLFNFEKAICHRTTISKSLPSTVEEGRRIISRIMSKCKAISLTADHWKDIQKNRTYMDFSASYVDLDKRQIMTRFINLKEVSGKGASDVEIALDDLFKIYPNLQHQQLFFTTDNGLKFMENLLNEDQDWISCMAHNLALFQKYAFFNDDPKKLADLRTNKKKNPVTLDFDTSKYPQHVIDVFLVMYGENVRNRTLCQEGSIELINLINLIYACKHLVRYIKQSNLQPKLESTLKQEVCTRWDSIYEMCRSVGGNENSLKELAELGIGKVSKYYNLVDFALLFEVKQVLKLFRTARLKLCYRFRPTLYRVINYTINLRGIIMNEDPEFPDIFKKSKSVVAAIFETKVMQKITPHHKCAAIFSPFDLVYWQEQTFRKYSNSDQTEIETILNKFELHIQPAQPSLPAEPKPVKRFKSDFFSRPLSMKSGSSSIAINTVPPQMSILEEFRKYRENIRVICELIENESTEYLNVSGEEGKADFFRQGKIRAMDDLVTIWIRIKDDYPKLYEVAMVYLPIQATNTASECIFSGCGNLITELTNQLKSETAEGKQFIYHNPDIFGNMALQLLKLTNYKFGQLFLGTINEKCLDSKDEFENIDSDEEETEPRQKSNNVICLESDGDSTDDDFFVSVYK